MNITAMGNHFSSYGISNGNIVPVKNIYNEIKVENSDESKSTQLDMRNVSINEVNSLVKAGHSELLEVVPFIQPNVLEQYNYSPESIGEHRVDLLGQVEKSIEFKNSIGEDTSYLAKLFASFNDLNGKDLSAKIDVSV